MHPDAARNRRRLRPLVYRRITELHGTGLLPLTEAIGIAAGEFGIGATLAARMFYGVKAAGRLDFRET